MLFLPIQKVNALPHEWVGVPKSEYGEQLWDRKSIKRNEDGSVRVLSKFIPKTKSEITKDILYTMDINCFEKSFRDVDVSIDEANRNFNDLAVWQDALERRRNKTWRERSRSSEQHCNAATQNQAI